jgi:peptidyl-prolyl cis-trans isomerase SurA
VKSALTMLAVLVLGTWVCAAPLQAEVRNRIVAVVNNEVITLSEVENAAEPYLARIRDTYKGPDPERVMAEARKNVLNRLIDNLLIEQEVKKGGFTVSDGEVMDAINDILANKKSSLEELQKALAARGMTFDAYKAEIRSQMIKLKLARREIRTKIAISDEEIGAYYVEHKSEYEGKEAVRLKQIILLVPKDADGATRDRLRAEAEQLHERLTRGEAFDQIAAKHSQGPAAETGGDIGFVERGSMLPEVEALAFALERGTISQVIATPVGFHIVMVVDKRGAGVKPIAYVREEIKAKIEIEKMEKKYEEWIEAVRRRSHIAIKLP